MFAAPATVLAPRAGSLADTPLPLLLHALFCEGRTVTLELKLRGLEKRIQFEGGSPVACRSNLLHETLGKFLVEKGKLTEARYQEALQGSVQTGKRMGEWLVSQGAIQPFELYRLMQANLAIRILDAFRWSEATWRLTGESEAAELALRMNPAQLVLTGVSGFSPFEVVATQLAFTDEQRFALAPRPPHELSRLKLDPREARLVTTLRRRPTFEEITQATGLEVEEALRRLYALATLGLVDFSERVPQAATPGPAVAPATAAPAPEPEPTAPPPAPEPLSEESDELKNALASDYLAHRTRDPFDLLGLPEAADAAQARRAFLELADRFSPLRFRSADLREKAEALLAARARAFGALSDPDQAAPWRRRRAATAEAARAPSRPSTEEQFRIQTDLLDAAAQFEEGKRRLAAGNARGALEYFQYAADIEPRAAHRAHLAWARFLVDPERNARLALGELAEVARKEPGCVEAHRFAADVLKAQGRWSEAETSYRRAFQLDPADKRSQEAALEMLRARRAAQR
jgi:curved DNA-binding protein CbpA/ribosomal protein L12E/L44/L45/RPP1/RPP2